MTVLVNATSERTPQEIVRWKTYYQQNTYWSGVRLVAWITQDSDRKTTRFYYKWQRGADGSHLYWNDAKTYTVILGGTTSRKTFTLGTATDEWVDMTTATYIEVEHDSNGDYSGALSVAGYKYWEEAYYNDTVTFPSFEPVTPETPETPPEDIEVDNIPYYYVYADGQLLYASNVEDYLILNPVLNLEINKSGSLSFEIATTNPLYLSLSKLRTTVEVRQGNEILFRGRILSDERGFYNTKRIYCEGVLSFLVDTVKAPYTFNGEGRKLLKLLLENHNTLASENRQLQYTYSDISSKVTVDNENYSYTLDEIMNNLLNNIGGFIRPYYASDYTGIQYTSSFDKTTSQVIRFGENLLDFNEYIDASSVFTSVLPLGKDMGSGRVKLSETYLDDAEAINVFGMIIRIVVFDNATTEAQLRELATAYLRTGVEASVTIRIKAVDLHLLDVDTERIRLGDSVRVVSKPHNVDSYFICTKMTLDLQNPSNNEYTFGNIKKTLTDITTST